MKLGIHHGVLIFLEYSKTSRYTWQSDVLQHAAKLSGPLSCNLTAAASTIIRLSTPNSQTNVDLWIHTLQYLAPCNHVVSLTLPAQPCW